MARSAYLLVVATIIIAASMSCVAAPGGEAVPAAARRTSVSVDMKDGSRVVGKAAPGTLRVDSEAAGELTVSLDALSSMEHFSSRTSWRLTFRNGDCLEGVPALKTLALDTSLGNVSVPLEEIARITVAHTALAAMEVPFDDPGEALEWKGLHNVTVPHISGGALVFDVTGTDPYLHRENMAVPADNCPVLLIRMRKEKGSQGQVFWTTDGTANFHDGAHAEFSAPADGQFHDILVPVSASPAWRGTITALRFDPDAGGAPGRVEIAAIRAATAAEAASLSPSGAPGEIALSLLDGGPFEAKPEWAGRPKAAREFGVTTTGGAVEFAVRDRESVMKWYHAVGVPFDAKEWRYLEFTYTAQNLRDDGAEYVVWLFDNRGYHAAGFEAVIAREIVADGKPHTMNLDLKRFNPAGPITGIAIRVLSGESTPATLAIGALRVAKTKAAPGEAGGGTLSLLDTDSFIARPEWVMAGRAAREFGMKGPADGALEFAVYDAGTTMKWSRQFAAPFSAKEWQYLELTYTAEGIRDSGVEDVLWLFDRRDFRGGGFEAVATREIVADGRPHTIVVDLARFNPAGPITGLVVCIVSGDRGSATFDIKGLRVARTSGALEIESTAEAAAAANR